MYLNIAEVEVYDQSDINEALEENGAKATQKSTYDGKISDYGAANAIDGNDKIIAHTKWEEGKY